MESSADIAGATWNPPECPFAVEYSFQVLDDIRLAVVDAFFSLPRGGAEIGGILLGKHQAGRVTVADYLALDCEHALGPSFNLSQRDRDGLAARLASAAKNQDLQPVGWYHSHTRSEIFLSDADQEIHNRFFPHAWQIALVLRPHTFQPCRAGFFFREADGAIHAASSYREFVLEALPMRMVPAASPVPPPRRDPDRGQSGPVITLVPEPEWPPQAMKPPQPQSASQVRQAEPEPERPEAHEPPVPNVPEPKRRPSRKGLNAVLAMAAALAVGAGGYQTRRAWLPRVRAMVTPAAAPAPRPSLGLLMSDSDGHLQIHWNHNSPAVRIAASGLLTVRNGGPFPQEIRLDGDHLQSGVYSLLRQSETVDATLLLDQPDGPPVHEATAFSGKLPAAADPLPDPAIVRERDSLALQLDRANGALTAEMERNKKLQRSVDVLRKQLTVQQRKRMENQVK